MRAINPFLIIVVLVAVIAFVVSKRQGKTTQQSFVAALVATLGLFAAAFILDLFIE